jgi:tetratricopeptide (TPR) repeat protein
MTIQRAYWRQRIRADVSDTAAYVALGRLEERTGYYSSAVKMLFSARALGASDAEVCGPLGRALTALARDDEALPELVKARQAMPESVEATLNLAGLYVSQGNNAQAATLMREFLAVSATLSTPDQTRLAFAFLECQENGEARKLAERILTTEPTNGIAHSLAARAAIAEQNLPAARQHLEAILKQSDTAGGAAGAGIYFLYGKVLEAQSEAKAARTQWEKTLRLNPMALDAHEQIGFSALRSKDYRRAATAFEYIAGRAPSAVSALRAAEVWQQAGDRERSAYWRSVAYGYQGRFAEGLAQAQIAANAKTPAVRRLGLQAMAESYRGLRKKNEYRETMLQLTAGGSEEDLLLRARAYQELDDHQKRTGTLRLAAEKASSPGQRAGILVLLAQAYTTRGMHDDAERTLEEAVRLQPNNPAGHSELARAYFARRTEGDRTNKAIRAWETALSLRPDYSDDWLKLGIAYSAAGDKGKAISALDHAIDLEPGSGPPYLELSRVYAQIGDKETAQRYNALYARYVAFDQSVQSLRTRAQKPTATARDMMDYGDALIKMGALDEAANQFEAARALQPKDAGLRRKLAALYGRLRMPERQQALLADSTEENSP